MEEGKEGRDKEGEGKEGGEAKGREESGVLNKNGKKLATLMKKAHSPTDASPELPALIFLKDTVNSPGPLRPLTGQMYALGQQDALHLPR